MKLGPIVNQILKEYIDAGTLLSNLTQAVKTGNLKQIKDAFAKVQGQHPPYLQPHEVLSLAPKQYKDLFQAIRQNDLKAIETILGIVSGASSTSNQSAKSGKKLTAQDLQVGDRVRVLQDTQPVWGGPGIPAGTELEVVAVGNSWVDLEDSKQNILEFYDPAAAVADVTTAAKRTLDNLEKIT